MKAFLALIVATSFFLAACGKTSKTTSDIPGEDQPKINQTQSNQVREFAGSLGDIAHYVESFGRKNMGVIEDEEIEDFRDVIVVRKPSRRRLKASIRLNRCRVKRDGSIKGNTYGLRVRGKRCAVKIVHEQNRISDFFNSEERQEVNYTKDFLAKGQVATDIMEVNISGKYTSHRRVVNNSSTRTQASNVTIEGQSAQFGRFSYRLDEFWEKLNNGGNGRQSNYNRTDTFIFPNSFEAVVYREESSDGVRDYFLNGERLMESQYRSLMQGLEKQVGMGRFTKGIKN